MQVETQLTYVSRHYRREPGHLNGLSGISLSACPGRSRSGFALAQEGDRWHVALGGWFGTQPPMDDEGLAGWADELDSPALAGLLRQAEPLGRPARMRFPASTRVFFERMEWFPAGLLVMGDGMCSFNPIYGQGITLAALEACVLGRLLKEGAADLGAAYFRETAAIIDVPWNTATGNDLRFPKTVGERPATAPERDEYLRRLRSAAADDPLLAGAFLRVTHLMEPVTALFTPDIAARVEAVISR